MPGRSAIKPCEAVISTERREAVEVRRVRDWVAERTKGEGLEMPRNRLVLDRRGKDSSKADSGGAKGQFLRVRQIRAAGEPGERESMTTASTKITKAVSPPGRESLGADSGRGSGC